MIKGDSDIGECARARGLHIAIDGPAGAGKSTVGRNIALALQCPFLDTGLMYRALTYRSQLQNIDPTDGEALGCLAKNMVFALGDTVDARLTVDNRVAGDELRTPQVDSDVSAVSAHAEVRSVMVERQRQLAAGRCIVMIGRDIGTTVLPDADVKLWVTASAEERARRRLEEHLGEGDGSDFATVLEQIRTRDAIDAERAVSPLRQPPDALIVQTEGRDPATTLQAALEALCAAALAAR